VDVRSAFDRVAPVRAGAVREGNVRAESVRSVPVGALALYGVCEPNGYLMASPGQVAERLAIGGHYWPVRGL